MATIADAVAAMRALADTTLTDACDVARAGVSLGYTMPDGSPLRCRVAEDSTRTHLPGTPAGAYAQQYVIVLPSETAGGVPLAVARDDVIAVASGDSAGVYTAAGSASPGTNAASTTAYAYRAESADPSDPATIVAALASAASSTAVACAVAIQDRAGGPKATGVPGWLKPPGQMRFDALGGETRATLYVAASADPARNVDIRPEDRVIFLAFSGVPSPTDRPFLVENVEPAGSPAAPAWAAYLEQFTLAR